MGVDIVRRGEVFSEEADVVLGGFISEVGSEGEDLWDGEGREVEADGEGDEYSGNDGKCVASGGGVF